MSLGGGQQLPEFSWSGGDKRSALIRAVVVHLTTPLGKALELLLVLFGRGVRH